MTNSQRLSAVRSALGHWIAQRHPQEEACGKPLSEAMLIREGFFCGRRFRFQLYHAVWFLEEDEVKILTLEGAVAARLDSAAIDQLALAGAAAEADAPQTLSLSAHREHVDAAAAPTPVTPQQTEAEPQRRAA